MSRLSKVQSFGIGAVPLLSPNVIGTNTIPLVDVTANLTGTTAGSGTSSFHFLNMNHRSRIRRCGGVTVKAATIAINDVDISTVTDVQVYVTRRMSTTYDVLLEGTVRASGNFVGQLTRNTISNVTFPTPITECRYGDYVRVSALGNIPAMFIRTSLKGTWYRISNATIANQGYDWEGTATPTSSFHVPVELYTDTGPHMSFDGNSLVGGSPSNRGYADPTAELSEQFVPVAAHLRTMTGNVLTYDIVSVAGSKVADQAARFDAYVRASYPRYLCAEYLTNDVGVTNKTDAFTSLTGMLDKCVTDGIKVILWLIPPSSFHDNTWHDIRDDWNSSLVSLQSSYSNLTTVSMDEYVGTFKSGGPVGNLRNIQTSLDAGDGVHFSKDGYVLIAKAIYDKVFRFGYRSM